jgi:uncharacterized membrane protein
VSGQLRAIFDSPLLLPTVVANSVRENGSWLFETLVGRLGWLDTPLPPRYYTVAVGVLICAWLASGNRPPYLFPALIGPAVLVAALLAIGAALYASWTPMGKVTLDGLQGRYVLPFLPLIAWATPGWGRTLTKALSPAWVVVIAFPLVSIAVLPGAIMARYYGSWSEMEAVLRTLFLT